MNPQASTIHSWTMHFDHKCTNERTEAVIGTLKRTPLHAICISASGHPSRSQVLIKFRHQVPPIISYPSNRIISHTVLRICCNLVIVEKAVKRSCSQCDCSVLHWFFFFSDVTVSVLICLSVRSVSDVIYCDVFCSLSLYMLCCYIVFLESLT